MNRKIGFIGCGKMAGAIITGIKNSCSNRDFDITGSEMNLETAEFAKERLDINVIADNSLLVKNSDVVFIAVKPDYVTKILDEIKYDLTGEKLLVSIAAGISTQKIEKIIGQKRVIRVMPNTPALVQTGMFGICKGKYALAEDTAFITELLNNIGDVIEFKEAQMDIVTAISGSGPAFFYQIIEDMARAGEKLGLNYEKSLHLAAQTALGSAKMIFNREKSTTVQNLIDNVATKGGCTFAGISVMKTENSAELFYNVIKQTAEKAHAL